MIAAVPLLVLVIGAYNFMALTGVGVDWDLFRAILPSGALLPFQFGDLLIVAGVVLLYLEIWKSTRTDSGSILDHLLSMILFVVALVEFLLFERFGTSVFAILLCLTFLDVVAGFTVSISAARRDFGTR